VYASRESLSTAHCRTPCELHDSCRASFTRCETTCQDKYLGNVTSPRLLKYVPEESRCPADLKGMDDDGRDDFSRSGEEDSEDSPITDDETTWIQWFCGLKGNEFFCEVDEDFIADDFNLAGLSSQVPYYEYALSIMLDADSPNQDALTAEQSEYVESAAELLYGLVHQRFILTSKGLSQMLDKYRNCHFGRCPRVGCHGQPCLPVGTSDQPRVSTVKVFCPKCEEIYFPRSFYQGNLDGAFFGTTFPHLLLLTFPAFRPAKSAPEYAPRIFGFKIHPTAYGNDKERNSLLPPNNSTDDGAAP
jgi:casein kinase II subunit beta